MFTSIKRIILKLIHCGTVHKQKLTKTTNDAPASLLLKYFLGLVEVCGARLEGALSSGTHTSPPHPHAVGASAVILKQLDEVELVVVELDVGLEVKLKAFFLNHLPFV